LLEGRPSARILVHALSILQAILVAGLLVILWLLLGLGVTRGIAALSEPRPGVPSWVDKVVPEETGAVLVRNSGLLAVGLSNQSSPHGIERFWGRGLLRVTQAIPPLRTNLGALLTLLAVGLMLVLAYVLTGQALGRRVRELPVEAVSALRRQIHRQMYRLGQSALPGQGIEPIIDLFTRSVDDLENGFRADLRDGTGTPALIVVLLLVPLIIHWPLALALISLTILTYLASRPLVRRARTLVEVASRNAQVQMRLMQEDLGLIRTVRVFGMESVDNRRFDEHLEHYRVSDVRRQESRLGEDSTFLRILVGTAGFLGLGLITLALMRWPAVLSPASAVILVLALVGVVFPLRRLRERDQAVRHAGRAATVIHDFLDRKPELQQPGGAQFLPPLQQRISFENVSLSGPSGKDLLDGVSVEIPAGTRVAVMGRDEESKHAFVCLIPRLIDPTQGRVRIDGHDLRKVTLESLRAQIATVLQHDLVFSDSVASNIGLGDPSFGLPRIIEAAKIAHAHNFIQDLPNGYDTVIGPLGHVLRVDEQYRIALARVDLHDPSIVIIEEPVGLLDDEIKALIDDSISRMSKGRTVIFLPHRLSTIRSCNQVLVLHNGRLEAVGTAKELQKSSKVFRHLQYVEFNQFATGEIEAGQMSGEA
jgi:ABC-type multidrug transport system fused ATPase/permease subunit